MVTSDSTERSAGQPEAAVAKPAPIVCPGCGMELALKHSVELPPDQSMSFVIEHEHPLLSLKTVHGTLAAIEKMLKATARDIGTDCHVFLKTVKCEPGRTQFDLFIADHDVKTPAKAASAKRRTLV